jgi:hypothetical protein
MITAKLELKKPVKESALITRIIAITGIQDYKISKAVGSKERLIYIHDGKEVKFEEPIGNTYVMIRYIPTSESEHTGSNFQINSDVYDPNKIVEQLSLN